MKSQKHLLSIAAALLFGVSGLFAQTSGGTTTGGTSTGGTSTGGTSTGGTSTGGTSTGGTSTGGTTTGGTSTGGTTTTTGSMHGKGNPHSVNPNSSAVAQAVQAILQKFDANRDQFMAERKALLAKLEAAKTDAERQAILAQLKADLQTEKDQRAQLGKEIRDELKNLRQQRKTGGG